MISKVLKENLGEKAETLVSKIKTSIKEDSEVCECGGNMYEGECTECGSKMMDEGIYDVEDINNKDEFDYVQEEEDIETETNVENEESCKYHMDKFGPDDDRTKQFCGDSMNESLKGRQRRQSKKSETDEGNAFTGALSQARKTGDKDFEVDGKKFETKEGKKFPDLTGDGKVTRKDVLVGRGVKLKNSKSDKSIKKVNKISTKHGMEESNSVRMSESEMVNLIEKIIIEQKSKNVKDPAEKTNSKIIGNTPGYNKYEQIHKKDGKENEDSLKAVAQKMKDYLKDGSKGEYNTNPKFFPKGNGELAKMDKKAYVPSEAVEDYIDNFTAAALENLDYDEIHPNEEWVTNNIEGSSKTGNNPDWANTGESDVNKKRNKIRKDNMLAKLKRMAYNKSPQPVVNDKDGGSKASDIMTKLESTEPKKAKQINEEFERMKSLIGYNQKTQ
jgi:hypothetical protein